MEAPFERAVQHVSASGAQTDNQTKLRLYALYKIATGSQRPEKGTRPGMLDFTGRAKWDAWDRTGAEEGMNPDQARRLYVGMVQERFGFAADADSTETGEDAGERSGPSRGAQPQKQERMVAVSLLADEFVDEEPPSKLHELALEGDAPALESFLSSSEGQQAALNARDSYGYTPLHLATDRGQTAAVRTLLRAGADKSIQDEDGNTALDLARLAEHEDIVALLI